MKKLTKNELRNKLKFWLLSHPKFNPLKFSFNFFFRNSTSVFRVLPDFIIIGSGRAGTTSLYSYLIQHPSIYAASTYNNKPVADLHFFEYMISDKISWYKSHFPTIFTKNYFKFKSKNNFVTGEYTSTYMYNRNVPKRIFKLIPAVKLIVILRNPVDKIYSTYSQQFFFNEFLSSFMDTINAELKRFEISKTLPELSSVNPDFENFVQHNLIRHGIYFDYLKEWMKIFPRNQILIVDSEKLKNSTQESLNKIFKFLNVSSHNVSNLSKINVGKYPPINVLSKEFLIEFYKPYNQKLNNLLNTSFDWNK